jgi:hypothetical protein
MAVMLRHCTPRSLLIIDECAHAHFQRATRVLACRLLLAPFLQR